MIEEASLSDAEEILAVINTSNREAYKSIIPQERFSEPVLSREKLMDDWRVMTFYTYRSAGRIVGVAALRIEGEKTGRIRWVYILPRYQRRGIGTALVTHIEQRARERGLRTARALVAGNADWAVAFYRRLGYDRIEKLERPWGFDLFMEKDL
jgi:ribosomal protein S18 acetylase RimI-like enzyme